MRYRHLRSRGAPGRSDDSERGSIGMSNLSEHLKSLTSEQRNYALKALPHHLTMAGMWPQLAQVFAEADYIIERSERFGFAAIYGDALNAAKTALPQPKWGTALSEWERFLRWRVERLRDLPAGYVQEVVNEFVPTAPELLAAPLARLRAHLDESGVPYLKKISGPAALGSGQIGIVYGIAFSPDRRFVMCGGDDWTVKIWDMESGELTAECVGHTDVVRCVAFSEDGRLVASGSNDRTVQIWESDTGRLITSCIGHKGWVSSVLFSHDGRLVASGDETVMIWEAETGRLVSKRPGRMGRITSLAFSPDGHHLAFGSVDGTAEICQVGSGQQLWDCAGR